MVCTPTSDQSALYHLYAKQTTKHYVPESLPLSYSAHGYYLQSLYLMNWLRLAVNEPQKVHYSTGCKYYENCKLRQSMEILSKYKTSSRLLVAT